VKVEVVSTKSSTVFFNPGAVVEAGSRIWRDEDEWRVSICCLISKLLTTVEEVTSSWQVDYKIGDPILHIELRRWADIVLVAPCSANTAAKIAGGICDNLAVRAQTYDVSMHRLNSIVDCFRHLFSALLRRQRLHISSLP
jgi:phosphopantothenoylcysteine decarboxylase